METRQIVIIVIMSMSSGIIGPCKSLGCPDGWFGLLCQYKCHCSDKTCSEDEVCNSGCEKGWFGPACQYVDLAVNGTVILNSTPEIKAVTMLTDNDMTTCLSGSNIVFNWTDPIPFSWLRIVFNDTAAVENIKVQFRNATSEKGIDCPNPGTAVVNRTTVDIHCDFYMTTKQVVLTGDEIKTFCSIHINGGRNVALKQEAMQSSTYKNFNASFAVDGMLGNDDAIGCSHTDNYKPSSWNLTLSRPQYVNRYVIHNRPSIDYRDRLKGFMLTSYDKNDKPVFNHTDSDVLLTYNILSTTEGLPVPIYLVKIHLENPHLTLCEVEIFGDSACEDGSYGRACNQTCNCAIQNVCFVSTGGCPSGCAYGYFGENCQTACVNNTYGQNCQFNCSSNCNISDTGSICNHINGHCLYGCLNGTSGSDCSVQPHRKSTDDDDSIGLIVGVVVAACLVIIIIGIISGAMYWRRKSSPKNQHSSDRGMTAISLSLNQNPGLGSQTSSTLASENKSYVSEEPVRSKSGPYYNSLNLLEKSTTAIAVKDLDAFISMHNKQYFREQFEKVPGVYTELAMNVGLSEENIHKNRYKNICAYDHSRVHLNLNQEKHEGDYINASYIEGYKQQERFIASQAPNRTILDDFVRMLWEQKSDKVVMLTNLIEENKVKCEKYWPDEDMNMFGEIIVELATTHVFADYTIRKLTLKKNNEPSHSLTQFHFTSWPDKGVPITPWALVDFEQRVFSQSTSRSIIVHCSAGVGRTGTFLALHNVIKQAQETGYVDFYTTLLNLRKDRVYMVQTGDQYIFLHEAAQVAIVCLNTTVPGNNIAVAVDALKRSSPSGLTFLEKEFEAVCILSAENDDSTYEGKEENNDKHRNRLGNILPKDAYRPSLSVDFEDTDDYINAVLAPSFTKLNGQILTQLPLPSTVLDFWRMVTQWQVCLIVAFEVDLKDTDSTVANYLPQREATSIRCGPFHIEAGPSSSTSLWDVQNLVISMNSVNNSPSLSMGSKYHVKHLKFQSTALNPMTFLKTAEQIRSCRVQNDGITLYMCRNGATYSGLACVLCHLLDRMDNDHCLTVPLVVGAMKSIRQQVIPTADHYKLLYDVLKCYQDSSTVYSNFGGSESVIQAENLPLNTKTTNKDTSNNSVNAIYANN